MDKTPLETFQPPEKPENVDIKLPDFSSIKIKPTVFGSRELDYFPQTQPGYRFGEQMTGQVEDIYPDTVFIPMNFMQVVTGKDEKHCVGTTSLASCLGVMVTDTEAQVAGVGHAFFTDKEMDEHYYQMTGQVRYRDKHNPFTDTWSYVIGLAKRAKEAGASKVKFTFFNVEHGVRTAEQNIQLRKTIDDILDKVKTQPEQYGLQGIEFDFEGTEFRHEQAFRVDAKTGEVLPYG